MIISVTAVCSLLGVSHPIGCSLLIHNILNFLQVRRIPNNYSLEQDDIDYLPMAHANYQGLLAGVNESIKIARISGHSDWHRWSHNEVREQVYNLMSQMEDLADREFVDHAKDSKDIATSGVRINREQTEIVTRITTLGENMQKIAHDLGASLSGLESDADQIYRRQGQYSAQEERDMTSIQAILKNHSQSIQSQDAATKHNRLYAQSELDSLKQEIISVLNGDRATLEQGNEQNQQALEQIHNLLDSQVQRLSAAEQAITDNLRSAKLLESRDFSMLDSNASAMQSELGNHSSVLDAIHSQQQAIRAENAEIAQRLGHEKERLADANAALSAAQAQEAANEANNLNRLQAVESQDQQLAAQQAAGTKRLTALEGRADAAEREAADLGARETRDYGDIRATQAELAADAERALAVGNEVGNLSLTVAANATRLAARLDGAAADRIGLERDMARRFADLAALTLRIAALENSSLALAGKEAADEQGVNCAVEAIRARIAALEGLRDEVEAAADTYDRQIHNLRAEVRAVDEAGNQTAAVAVQALADLEAAMNGQLQVQKEKVEKVSRNASLLQAQVAALALRQDASAASERLLAAKVANATKTLADLNAHYSKLAVDTGAQLDALQTAAAALPASGGTAAIAAQAAALQAAEVAKDVKALAARVDLVLAQESQSKAVLQGLVSALHYSRNNGTAALSSIQAQLAGEGQLLGAIARKLGDDDLLLRVTKVFSPLQGS